MEINARGLHYRTLNERIREAVRSGAKRIRLVNVNGQRFIADGLVGPVHMTIEGVPGNDLGAFMNGPTIIVHANGQDHIANTMNDGKIVVHGDAGDVLGYGMRGGRLYIKGDVGYRVGIHMKAYRGKVPVIVVGGKARDFFGEYMAGGTMVILGLNRKRSESIVGNYFATGMHGGVIYVRGVLADYQLGKEVEVKALEDFDWRFLKVTISDFAREFHFSAEKILESKFVKIIPQSHRPYGSLYAY
jgi:glutamate synthase domain-containing protein 3